MQFTNILSFLLPFLFALCVRAQDVTSVSTYYTTYTVSRIVETTTCTSTTTPAPVAAVSTAAASSSSSAPLSFTTEILTQTVQRIAASSSSSSSSWVASASAGMPKASGNGTTVATSAPTVTVQPYAGAAAGLTVQVGAAAFIAAVAGVAQML